MSLESPSGLTRILDEQRLDLRRFLIARTGSEADADDVLSELWIKANSAQAGPISNPKGYLFRMANNLVLDRVREANRRLRRENDWVSEQHDLVPTFIEPVDPAIDAEQMLIAKDEADRLVAAIERLPAGAQRVLRMHKFEGLGHGEVAERLGISKSAVEKHMAVAMTYLRRILSAEAEEDPRRPEDNKGGPIAIETGLKS
jgi:RNA polymerase sigma factor (sigma-70 family)